MCRPSGGGGEFHRKARDTGAHVFRRFSIRVALFALVASLASCISLWVASRNPLEAKLGRVQRDVGRLLHELAESTPAAAHASLVAAQDRVGSWRDEFRNDVRRTGEQESSLRRLYELEKSVTRWTFLTGSQPDESFPIEIRWKKVRAEVQDEQKHWPEYAPPLEFSIPPGFRHMGYGAVAGVAWPYFMIRRVLEIPRSGKLLRGGLAANFPFCFRYVLFPHTKHTLTVPWVFGFGLVAVLSGYGLCWFGMKRNVSAISTLGVVYLFYVVLFALFLALLVWGIW